MVLDVETAGAPVVVEEVSTEAETASETAETPVEESAEVPAQEPAELSESELAAVDEAIRSEFGEAAPESAANVGDDERVTLTKAELEERVKRERQSAQDRARYEAEQAQQERNAQLQTRARIRSEMRRDIGEELRRVVDAGEPNDRFVESIAGRYERAVYDEATELVAGTLEKAAYEAVSTRAAMKGATEADWEPVQRPARTPRDVYANLLEVAVNAERREWEKEVQARIEREARKLAEVKSQAIAKKVLLGIRQSQPAGELPAQQGAGDGLSRGQQLEARLARGEVLTPQELGEYAAYSRMQS